MAKRHCRGSHWVTTGTQYMPPADHLRSADSLSQESIQAVLYGITNLTQVCSICGWAEITTVPGKVSYPASAES